MVMCPSFIAIWSLGICSFGVCAATPAVDTTTTAANNFRIGNPPARQLLLAMFCMARNASTHLPMAGTSAASSCGTRMFLSSHPLGLPKIPTIGACEVDIATQLLYV